MSARKVSLHSRRFPLASHVLGKESGREREKRKGPESYASSLNSSGRGRRGEIHFQVATDERTTHGPVSSLPCPSFTRKIGPLIPVAGIAIEFSPNCAGQTRDPTLWWHADSRLWRVCCYGASWNFRFSSSRWLAERSLSLELSQFCEYLETLWSRNVYFFFSLSVYFRLTLDFLEFFILLRVKVILISFAKNKFLSFIFFSSI